MDPGRFLISLSNFPSKPLIYGLIVINIDPGLTNFIYNPITKPGIHNYSTNHYGNDNIGILASFLTVYLPSPWPVLLKSVANPLGDPTLETTAKSFVSDLLLQLLDILVDTPLHRLPDGTILP